MQSGPSSLFAVQLQVLGLAQDVRCAGPWPSHRKLLPSGPARLDDSTCGETSREPFLGKAPSSREHLPVAESTEERPSNNRPRRLAEDADEAQAATPPSAQTRPWNPHGEAGGSLHLWEDASWGRESCFAQKAPPLREGEARQNRGVTRSGTSAGNGENMPCGTSLFLGGKRPRNRAGLGRDHPSTRYRLGPFSGCRAWAPHHHTHTQGSPLPSARLLTRLPTPDSARRTNGSRTRSGQPTHRGCAAWQRTGLSAGTEGQSEKRRPGGVFQLC